MRPAPSSSRGVPWGTILVILTLLAAAYAYFEPDDDAGADGQAAGLVSDPPNPLVRHTTGWAPAATATVHPGMQTITEGAGQCTSNFVFTDVAGNVYLGQAAHCATDGKQLNGCKAKSRPIGTEVTFNRGATRYDRGTVLARGKLAYSSWLTMQRIGERDRLACAYNDFALIRLDRSLRPKVNPSVPFWGGPTDLAQRGVYTLEKVYGFGKSSLRKAGSTASRQSAITAPDKADLDGWSHTFYGYSPGIPGDSGSGYLDSDGRALGTLSTLAFGMPMANTIGDLPKELDYARKHSGIRGLRLEAGTEPFNEERAAQAR